MKKIFFLLVLCSLYFIPFVFSQNTGIGTTSPEEKLHVAGNVKADTLKPNALKLVPNAGAGKLLTSDGAGNASWQTTNTTAAGNVGFGLWGDCATNEHISEYLPITDSTGNSGDHFGHSVSTSGNYAIIGAYLDDGAAGANQGSASIYQYTGGTWVLMQKITDAGGAASDNFGISVSISGNYAIVGAYHDDGVAGADQGSVSIYQYTGGSWVLMQKIFDAGGAASDNFGKAVSISGNYAIIGANLDNGAAGADQGSVSIYQYTGGSWVLMQKIFDATGAASDNFGFSVSISGNYAIVGSYLDDGPTGVDQGSASIYQYTGASWVVMQKLIDDIAGDSADNFGYSVSISGNYAIVGIWLDNDASNSTLDIGAANIYQYTGSSWLLMHPIRSAVGGEAGERFGNSVSISGNYAIVGAYRDEGSLGLYMGSATIYIRQGQGWSRWQYITDPLGNSNDMFGFITAIDGATKRFLIGIPNFTPFSTCGKIVFGKIN